MYYWMVNAKNPGGTSPFSIVDTFTTVPPPPIVPVLGLPQNGAINIITTPTLSWTTIPGAVTYRVQLSTISTFATTIIDDSSSSNGLFPIVTPLGLSNVYFWRVNAKNPGGTSAFALPFSFTTIPPVPASSPSLIAPVNGATNVAQTPALTWNTIVGATKYWVQVSTSSTFSPLVVSDSTPTTGYDSLTTPLSLGTQYYWQVSAKNAGGTGAPSIPFSFTVGPNAPAVPVLALPANAAVGIRATPALTWGTVAGAVTYHVQLSTSSTFATTVIDDSTRTAGMDSITTPLINLMTYYWRVSAKNAGGSSAYSTMFSFTVSSTGIITAHVHYVPITLGHSGVLELYRANGAKVMAIAYEATATKADLLSRASKSLAQGYYTYRFRSTDAQSIIVGRLIK